MQNKKLVFPTLAPEIRDCYLKLSPDDSLTKEMREAVRQAECQKKEFGITYDI